MVQCSKCGEAINPARLKILPDTKVCVDCSTEEAKAAVDIVYHKTGNTIQIMDAEQAEKINKASERVGFGSMRAMRGSSADGKTKVRLGQNSRIPRRATEEDFERVGQRMTEMMEFHSRERILRMINDEYESRLISGKHRRKLIDILNELMPERRTEKKSTYVPDVDENIEWVFKNWKNSKTYK